jgi:tRNA A37 methylthiotransferase MiaB
MKKALSLGIISSLLGKVNSVVRRFKIKRTKSVPVNHTNYLKKAYNSFKVDPTAHRSVQSLKKALKNHPSIHRPVHNHHKTMNYELKQQYTSKRLNALNKLSQAKMHRASQKLKGNLQPSKRAKLSARLSRMTEKYERSRRNSKR